MNLSIPRLTCVLVSVGSILVAAPVAGQQTRDEAIAAAQAEKATVLRPYVADPVERRVERVARLLTSTPTIYTYIGSVFPGGQLAVGPGVRKRYASTGAFDIHGGWSLRNYKLVDATLGLPDFADSRIKVTSRAQWIDAPNVDFYGIGPESPKTDPSQFSYRSATGGVSGRLQAARFVAAGGGIDVLEFETDREGLRHSPVYTRGQVFGEIDWRQSPGYTTRGGLYRVGWSNYDEHANGLSSFRRLDVEVDQFVPLLRANWVLAFRGLASFTDVDDENAVPYFLLPELGGGRSLRGYPTWRFRDRQRLLLTGEYRWTAGQFVDMALFLDAGQVAARRSDFSLNDLRTGYGIGVRFHTPAATMLRAEIARGDEGTQLIFAFGPSF